MQTWNMPKLLHAAASANTLTLKVPTTHTHCCPEASCAHQVHSEHIDFPVPFPKAPFLPCCRFKLGQSPLTPSSVQHSGIIFPGKHTGRKCPHASTTTDATSLGTTSLWSNTMVVALKLCHTQCDAPDSVMMPLAQSNSCLVRQRQCVASVTKCQVSQPSCGANAVGRMNCGAGRKERRGATHRPEWNNKMGSVEKP